jgi:hypothetical protein
MRWLNTLLDAALTRRMRKSTEPLGGWQPKHVACWDCGLTHQLPVNVRQALASAEGFFSRHEGHQTNWFEQPGLAGLWTPNADVKDAHGASAAYAITLTSLATTSAGILLAGRGSTAVNNTANLYLNYLAGGRITMGTVAATADRSIEIHGYGSVNDTPTYPDTITGSDANITLTSANVKRAAVRLIERIFVDTTASRVYWFGPVSLAQIFGGNIPKYHGLFVTQDSAQSLHSTAGNHVLNYTGYFQTVI